MLLDGNRQDRTALTFAPTNFQFLNKSQLCKTIPHSDRLQGPKLITSIPGSKAQEIIARDRAVTSPSYTRDYPLVAKRGEGSLIEDVDGNVFLDLTAGIAVAATGHAHPQVVQAINQQSQQLLHMCGG